MGITPEEFWALTPAQFMAYAERVSARAERADYRAGVISAVLKRVNGAKRAQPFDDFPWHKRRRKQDDGRMSFEETKEMLLKAAKRKTSKE